MFGTSGTSQAGFGRVQMAPGMTYRDIATPCGVEVRLGGASGGLGWFNKAAFCCSGGDVADWDGLLLHLVRFRPIACAAANPGVTCGTLYSNGGTGIICGPG